MPCAFFRFSFFLIPPTFDGERDVRAALPFFSLLLLRTLDTALIRRMRSSSASKGSALAMESICSNRSDMSAAVAGAFVDHTPFHGLEWMGPTTTIAHRVRTQPHFHEGRWPCSRRHRRE